MNSFLSLFTFIIVSFSFLACATANNDRMRERRKMIVELPVDSPSLVGPSGKFLHAHITHDNSERNFYLYYPKSEQKKSRAIPLVVLLHGFSGDAEGMLGMKRYDSAYQRYIELAESKGFMLLLANGTKDDDGKQFWNDCREGQNGRDSVDDLGFIIRAIRETKASYSINDKKVYVTGTSNGGFMSLRLLSERPYTFAAAGAIVSAMPKDSECRNPRVARPVLFMNGTKDRIVPYRGGAIGRGRNDRGSSIGTERSARLWADVAKLKEANKSVELLPNLGREDKSSVVKITFSSQRFPDYIRVYKVLGGGHTEPSLKHRDGKAWRWIVGQKNWDIEMADEVWSFFAGKSL